MKKGKRVKNMTHLPGNSTRTHRRTHARGRAVGVSGMSWYVMSMIIKEFL